MSEEESKSNEISSKVRENFQNDPKFSERKDKILKLLRDRRNEETHPIFYKKTAERNKISAILEKNKAEREELKNKALEQDIKLKKETLATLFWFLKIETVIIFCFTWFQATEGFRFELEEWSFKLFIGATITQITAMLLIAVQHLFPKK